MCDQAERRVHLDVMRSASKTTTLLKRPCDSARLTVAECTSLAKILACQAPVAVDVVLVPCLVGAVPGKLTAFTTIQVEALVPEGREVQRTTGDRAAPRVLKLAPALKRMVGRGAVVADAALIRLMLRAEHVAAVCVAAGACAVTGLRRLFAVGAETLGCTKPRELVRPTRSTSAKKHHHCEKDGPTTHCGHQKLTHPSSGGSFLATRN